PFPVGRHERRGIHRVLDLLLRARGDPLAHDRAQFLELLAGDDVDVPGLEVAAGRRPRGRLEYPADGLDRYRGGQEIADRSAAGERLADFHRHVSWAVPSWPAPERGSIGRAASLAQTAGRARRAGQAPRSPDNAGA